MKSIMIILLFFPQVLLAKTIFEPSVSLGRGVFKGQVASVNSNTEFEASYTTLAAGVRYGITREYIHVTAVADGYYVKTDSSAIASNSDFQGNLGIGIGYEWNIPLRTYVILGVPTSSVEMSYYFNETFMVGLRYNRMSVKIDTTDVNIDAIGVAVSFPFEFSYPSHWWRKKDWE